MYWLSFRLAGNLHLFIPGIFAFQQIFGICLAIMDIYKMCGITGIVQFHPNQGDEENRNKLYRRLKKMADTLAHRGPDGEGFWISPSGLAGLGHRRLSIRIYPQPQLSP